jgi:hypothetical protein
MELLVYLANKENKTKKKKKKKEGKGRKRPLASIYLRLN